MVKHRSKNGTDRNKQKNLAETHVHMYTYTNRKTAKLGLIRVINCGLI